MIDPQEQRATILFSQGRYDLAQKELLELLARQPDHAVALTLLALCRMNADDVVEATHLAQRAIAAAPDHPLPHFGLALVYESRRMYEGAEHAIREAIRLNPYDAEYYGVLARLRFALEDWQGSLQASDTALACDPENAAALNLRAAAQKKLGLTAQAGQQLKDALHIDPENPWTHANLGWTLLEQGDQAGAEQHFREALRLDPNLEFAREGVLESLKSSNILYRWWLDYRFWMARQTTWVQWTIILGLVFGQRILNWIGSLDPTLALVTTPLLWLYLLFVATSILMRPLTNVFLWFHPFGRLALTEEEITEAAGVAAMLGSAIALWLLWVLLPWPLVSLAVFPLAIGVSSVLFPFALTNQQEEGYPRQIMRWYAYLLAFISLCIALNLHYGLYEGMVAEMAGKPENEVLAPVKAALSYCIWPIYGAAASTWLANILASQRWQR